MIVKRCAHCKMINGESWPLMVGMSATCTICGCIWNEKGEHLLAGSVKGITCGPQDQIWGTPL